MKKILCICFAMFLAFMLSASVFATNTDDEQRNLSDLSNEELITFLKERGVAIPSVPEDEMAWAAFSHSVIIQVEENPNVVFLYGNTTLLRFANDIKKVVNEYYNRVGVNVRSVMATPVNILQDSTVYGPWSDDYLGYNCYAYAIGREESLDPGVSLWIELGNDASTYRYNDYANMNTITYWIQSDLEYFGYTVNSISNIRPNIDVGEHVHLICVRRDADGVYQGTTNDGVDIFFHDYHVMKLEADGNWYHKPGQTNPLRYLYQPTNERVWLSEGYYKHSNGYYYYLYDSECTYDSEIYFIQYTTPHTYVYRQCGVGQHVRTCTVCGETAGPIASCVFINDVCRICGGRRITEGTITAIIPPKEDAPV